jgi:hypothetical protein
VNDAVKRSDELDEKIAGTPYDPKASGRTNRRLMGIGAVLVVLCIALSATVGVLALRASERSVQIQDLQHQVYLTCVADNQDRENERRLWEAALMLVPSTTPEQQRQVAAVRDYADDVFAARNC